jgi:hypothetical protein
MRVNDKEERRILIPAASANAVPAASARPADRLYSTFVLNRVNGVRKVAMLFSFPTHFPRLLFACDENPNRSRIMSLPIVGLDLDW